MNKKNLLVLSLFGLASTGQALPALFKTTYRFELKVSEEQLLPITVEEHLVSGEAAPALLSWQKGKKVFLMEAPSVDRCGVIHFSGHQVTLERRESPGGDEVRFYEKPTLLDISCVPIPFPRCGHFKSSDHKTVGTYVEEQLKLLGAQCEATLVESPQKFESFQIRTVANLTE